MKRIGLFITAALFCLSLPACQHPAAESDADVSRSVPESSSSCSAEDTTSAAASYTTFGTSATTAIPTFDKNEIEEKGKNYIIYEGRYEIYDNDHKLLDSQDFRICRISNITQDILRIETSGGTNCEMYKYYNVKSRMISDRFDGPIANTNRLVAYFTFGSKNELIVQDIFTPSKYYKKFSAEKIENEFKATPYNACL